MWCRCVDEEMCRCVEDVEMCRCGDVLDVERCIRWRCG